jgi:signal transduction histidine kinase
MLTIKLSQRLHHTPWLLPVLLSTLHAALWLGVTNPWARPLMLAHLGLFLIWQPIWRNERHVSPRALVFISISSLLVIFALNWWLMAFWLIGLFGLVGGRIAEPAASWNKPFDLSKMAYLLTLLLLWVVPNLFADPGAIEIGNLLVSYVLPIFLPIMLLAPKPSRHAHQPPRIDFFYSLLLFMLLALVVLGSLAFMTLAHINYLNALLRTLFLIGLILLALGGLWNPSFGFNGLQMMLSRYLLNIGTPFERWLAQLAHAAQTAPDSTTYLKIATHCLAELSWLTGVSWQTNHTQGELGSPSLHKVILQEGELQLTIYTQAALSPTGLLHINLLTQLLGHFYQAKQREQHLRDITRMQAIYETGSRLTHDLKNMLQSLLSLTDLAHSNAANAATLLRKQLPTLSARIEHTLSQLQAPELPADTPQLALDTWWHNVQLRHQNSSLIWQAPTLNQQRIPVALFDNVLDNLLSNALRKPPYHKPLIISVSLTLSPRLALCVHDNGHAIASNLTPHLLHNTLHSQNGLGIGLYQAAQWAEQLNFKLTLVQNQSGAVCFKLSANPHIR